MVMRSVRRNPEELPPFVAEAISDHYRAGGIRDRTADEIVSLRRSGRFPHLLDPPAESRYAYRILAGLEDPHLEKIVGVPAAGGNSGIEYDLPIFPIYVTSRTMSWTVDFSTFCDPADGIQGVFSTVYRGALRDARRTITAIAVADLRREAGPNFFFGNWRTLPRAVIPEHAVDFYESQREIISVGGVEVEALAWTRGRRTDTFNSILGRLARLLREYGAATCPRVKVRRWR
jgi:hypothetical protein